MKSTYTTVQGDTWDIIAKNVYGYEKYADFLMQNNWNQLDFMIFPGGITLNTPTLTKKDSTELPIWRD
jgi:phage tail protein X